jgi:hypothetical protein
MASQPRPFAAVGMKRFVTLAALLLTACGGSDAPTRDPDEDAGAVDAAPGEDAGAAPGEAYCCLDDAACGPGRHCSAGRCWSDLPRGGPCAAGDTCEAGRTCVAGACQPVCGCATDADCPAHRICVTTDRACGQCLSANTGCTLDCAAPPDPSLGIWPDPFPDRPDDQVSGDVTAIAPDRFTVATAGGPRTWRYALPAGRRLPFDVGDRVSIETLRDDSAPDGLPGWRVEITTTTGRALGFLSERVVDRVGMFGVSMRIEDVGCAPNVIGDCVQSRNAAAVVQGRGLTNGDTQDVTGFEPLELVVTAAIIDEDACRPEERGPRLAAFLFH